MQKKKTSFSCYFRNKDINKSVLSLLFIVIFLNNRFFREYVANLRIDFSAIKPIFVFDIDKQNRSLIIDIPCPI